MQIHADIQQGTEEWAALRAKYFTASEAPAMMGASKYQTRSDLLKQKATGITPEVDQAKQRLFDAGHAAEAAARPFAESVIGEELFPVTCSTEIDGLQLLASLDGLVMDESIAWEHKLWNSSLADNLSIGVVEPHYYWQLEQQLLVTGASKVLLMASSENQEAAEYCWYESKPDRRAQLIAGWKQFKADLESYVPQEVIPAAVATPIEGFGALVLNVEGRVLACNLDAFNTGARAFIARLPKSSELTTDQHFADAEAATKACSEAETRIKAAKDAAMAQAADIDKVFRSVDLIAEEIRQARLSLEKAVKSRKESIRVEIMQDAQAKLAGHVKNLNERIGWFNGRPIISPAAADFATAIKGRKTVASLRDACNNELTRATIETSMVADKIEANRKAMGEHGHLFPDFAQVCAKAPDDFANLVAMRIKQHEEAEAKRKAEKLMRDSMNAAAPSTPTPEKQPERPVDIAPTIPLWQKERDAVAAMLDDLTVAELKEVAKYINNQAWRKAA
jgi:putative phage-type endonuclease